MRRHPISNSLTRAGRRFRHLPLLLLGLGLFASACAHPSRGSGPPRQPNPACGSLQISIDDPKNPVCLKAGEPFAISYLAKAGDLSAEFLVEMVDTASPATFTVVGPTTIPVGGEENGTMVPIATAGIPDGTYLVRAKLRQGGDCGEQTLLALDAAMVLHKVKIGNKPPTIDCISPKYVHCVIKPNSFDAEVDARDPDSDADVRIVIEDAGGTRTVLAGPVKESDGLMVINVPTATAPTGIFKLLATIEDECGEKAECEFGRIVICDGSGNCPPLIHILEPSTKTTVWSNQTFEARWKACDVDSVALINFFLDVDGDFATKGDQYPLTPQDIQEKDGFDMAMLLPDPATPNPGDYFLFGEVVDEKGNKDLDMADGKICLKPCTVAFEFTKPAVGTTENVETGNPYTFEWLAEACHQPAWVTLYVDLDGDPLTTGDQFQVSDRILVDPMTFTWADTSIDFFGNPVPLGRYTALGLFEYTTSPLASDWVTGGNVCIWDSNVPPGAPPSIDMTVPAAMLVLLPGEMFEARWIAQDDCFAGTCAEVTVWMEDVLNPGVRLKEQGPFASTPGIEQSVMINTLGLPDGTYCVVGYITDGGCPATDTADGKIKIESGPETPCVISMGGPSKKDEVRKGLATLPDGCAYVAGGFEDYALFGSIRLDAEDAEDMFLVKLDKDCKVIWARRDGGESEDKYFGVASLSDGGAVATGEFTKRTTWGKGEANETTFIGDDKDDGSLARYNPDGTLAWVVGIFGEDKQEGYNCVELTNGDIAVTGYFREEIIFAKGLPNELRLPGSKYHDTYVAVYSRDGDFKWARTMIGEGDDDGYDIEAGPDGSIVVAGSFEKDLQIQNGPTLQAVKYEDVFVARWDANGNLLWAVRAGGEKADVAMGVAVRADNSVAVTGYFEQDATFGTGASAVTIRSEDSSDVFYVLYAADGTLLWARAAGGADEQVARDVQAAPDGSLVLTGVFKKTLTFDSGLPSSVTLDQTRDNDGFIARIEPDGALRWLVRAGGAYDTDPRKGLGAHDVGVFPSGTVGVLGRYDEETTFGSGASKVVLKAVKYIDVYFARYAADGSF